MNSPTFDPLFFLNNSIQEIKMVLIEVKITPEKTPDNIHLRNIKRNQKRGNAGVKFNGFQSGIVWENRGGFD